MLLKEGRKSVREARRTLDSSEESGDEDGVEAVVSYLSELYGDVVSCPS
jgi:hypothetical protein